MTEEEFVGLVMEPTGDRIVRGVPAAIESLGLAGSAGRAAEAVWWFEGCLDLLCLTPGAGDALELLRRDYLLGIISNGDSKLQREKCRQLRLDSEVVVISGDCGFEKPDARIFQKACSLAEVEPPEAVFVGGSSVGKQLRLGLGNHPIPVLRVDVCQPPIGAKGGFRGIAEQLQHVVADPAQVELLAFERQRDLTNYRRSSDSSRKRLSARALLDGNRPLHLVRVEIAVVSDGARLGRRQPTDGAGLAAGNGLGVGDINTVCEAAIGTGDVQVVRAHSLIRQRDGYGGAGLYSQRGGVESVVGGGDEAASPSSGRRRRARRCRGAGAAARGAAASSACGVEGKDEGDHDGRH